MKVKPDASTLNVLLQEVFLLFKSTAWEALSLSLELLMTAFVFQAYINQ